MEFRDTMYIIRLLLALLGGTLSGLLNFGLEEAGFVILTAAIIYLATIYYAYFKFRREGKRPDLKILFIEGIGTYIIFWLFMWTIVYNILIFY